MARFRDESAPQAAQAVRGVWAPAAPGTPDRDRHTLLVFLAAIAVTVSAVGTAVVVGLGQGG